MKQIPGDIILNKCTIWFLRYGAWWTELFVIFGLFLPFYPSNNPKNKIFEKMKKKTPRDIIILHKCSKNHDHMLHWQPKKSEFKKTMKKNPGDIMILHMCTTNYGHMMYSSWDMVCDRWTDRQTEKKKWHIEVGAPPKNWNKCRSRHILFFSKINHIFKGTTTFIFENNKNMNKFPF